MFPFELEILQWFEGIRTDFFNALFQGVTFLGEEVLMILIVVTLWFAVDRRLGQKVLFVTASALAVNVTVKNFTKIPRPFTKGISGVRTETATGYSFPSGHTQMFSTWSTLFALRLRRLWVSALTVLLILAVGFSRVYLGVHYPSDVIGGILFGVSLAVLGNFLFDRIKDTRKLYVATLIVFLPLVAYFLVTADPLFEDLYKLYGMLCGLTLVSFLERTCEPLDYGVSVWKKVLRVVIGLVVAFALKEGIKAMNVFEIVQISLLFDILRYFLVVLALGYLCPLLFRKLKL